MLQKNTKNIYQWSIGKTENEIKKYIILLQIAIEMAKTQVLFVQKQTMQKALRKEIVKTMDHAVKKNEEAISFLKMDLAMKILMKSMG